MHEYANGSDGDDADDWEALDGGPVVPGVDYDGAWREAQEEGKRLLAVLRGFGMVKQSMWAKPGITSDGSGLVFLEVRGATPAIREFRRLLERFAERA